MARRLSALGWLIIAIGGLSLVGGDEETKTSPLPTAQTIAPISRPPATPAKIALAPSGYVETAAIEPVSPDIVVSPSDEKTFLYTRASARIRSEPTTKSAIISTLPAGEAVRVTGSSGDWHRVAAIGVTGWIRRDLLTDRAPLAQPIGPARKVKQPAPRSATVQEPLYVQPQRTEPPIKRRSSSGGGTPIRDAYVGTCDCPYDRMRNGRLCGGRSAYSRPGGRSPICYE